jgi:hypothetical protein
MNAPTEPIDATTSGGKPVFPSKVALGKPRQDLVDTCLHPRGSPKVLVMSYSAVAGGG